MKTLHPATKQSLSVIFSFILICAMSISSNAQIEVQKAFNTDALFPVKGRSMITIGTGIPYVGMAEYTYGISNRFAIGLVAGTTPIVPGYGIRIKSVLFQSKGNFRVFFKAPILYYPKTKGLGGEPWFLSWPSLNADWKLDSGVRLSAGVGMVAAACANDLLGLNHPHEDKQKMQNDHQSDHDGHTHSHGGTHEMTTMQIEPPDEGFMGNTWNTIQTGISAPLSNRLIFHSEVALVLDGISIADENWIGQVPVIVFVGMSYTF